MIATVLAFTGAVIGVTAFIFAVVFVLVDTYRDRNYIGLVFLGGLALSMILLGAGLALGAK